MKISHVTLKNFRNVSKIDVKFGNINILTGQNASGKTNILQFLTGCLEKNNDDLYEKYGNNIVMFGKGKDVCESSVVLSSMGPGYFSFSHNEKTIQGFQPREFTVRRTINKEGVVTNIEIDYDGKYLEEEIDGNDVDVETHIEKLKTLKNKKITKAYVKRENIGDIEIYEAGISYVRFFDRRVDSPIFFGGSEPYSNTGKFLFDFITKPITATGKKIHDEHLKKEIVDYIKKDVVSKKSSLSFSQGLFIKLLADVQKHAKFFAEFIDDIQFYTDGIVKNVEINISGKDGFISKGDIYVESPHGPKDIEYVSSGTATILFFVLLKHWTRLDESDRQFRLPSVMIFDELDAPIHPRLIGKFSELLYCVSDKIQLFISSHSGGFIDEFEKNDVYYILDNGRMGKNMETSSNILSYQHIIESTDSDIFKEELLSDNVSNSQLYIEGYLDDLFPKMMK